MEQKKSIIYSYIINCSNLVELAKVLTNLANALSEQGYTVEILLLMNERETFLPFKP